ncbi:MAG: TetR/AcrR family transcriptional regulator [Pseudonocardiaceae bacterium]
MPRGVAIPELRERLFQAAERLLVRDGPSGLSTRAITTEAGCAKGVLHNHFTDLDGFLAEFVLACFHAVLHDVTQLQAKAGQATVRDNLAESAASLLGSPVLAAHSILLFRPSLAARLHATHGHHSPNLADMERVFTAYLDAEQERGRVLTDTDTKAVALAFTATVHHILMTRRMDTTTAREALNRVLDVLLTATTPRDESGRARCLGAPCPGGRQIESALPEGVCCCVGPRGSVV